MAKVKVPQEEKLDYSVKLFDLLDAIDRKDYGYYSRLTAEQKKRVAIFILVKWTSAVSANADTQNYYLQSVNYHANKHLLQSNVAKHPELQWMMLCASSPGNGKKRHLWIPQLKEKVTALKEHASSDDVGNYFSKIYPSASISDVKELTKEYIRHNKRKVRLGELFPGMKIEDIEILDQLISDEDLACYEKELGN